MLKQHLIKSLICLAPLMSPGIASAAIFDYNITNFGLTGSPTVDTAGMTVDGITVNIEAYTIANDGAGTISGMTLLSSGTGVYVSGSSNNIGVRSRITGDGTNMDGGASGDASDLDEGLLFVFDQAVRLDFINFDSFTDIKSDDFNLTVDGVSLLVDYNANSSDPLVTNDIQFDYYYFNGIVGTEFLIWADGNTDSFRIDAMTVSAVPVPAAVWLFGSGLLGLVGVARRR